MKNENDLTVKSVIPSCTRKVSNSVFLNVQGLIYIKHEVTVLPNVVFGHI